MATEKQKEKKGYSRDDVYTSPAMRWWTVIIWMVIITIAILTYQIYGFVKQVKHKWQEINSNKHGRIL